mmetsp:Transcript_60484/g.143056  ORF Transcript_60484/g.143056 Transcript_60484/m.143056 type:complete len:95 (-) Transcript_60484:177-461(-)
MAACAVRVESCNVKDNSSTRRFSAKTSLNVTTVAGLRCHGHPLSPYTLSLLSPSPLSSSCRGKRHHKEPHAGVAQTATVQRTPRPEVRSEEASG